jgi:hypothetical protein
MEDIIDIIVTETTNLIEITSQPTDEIIDVNIIDNREDITLNVTPSVVEININSLTGNFGVNWGDIEGTLSNQTDLQNVLNAKADLVDGKVPSSQLPSYVDDVVEVANYASLPVTGEVGKIYITLDTNFIYRWSGSTYIEIKDSSAVWGAITGTLSSQTDLQSALDAKVPYTGATANVDLGWFSLAAEYLKVQTGTTHSTSVGEIVWNAIDGTFDMGLLNGVTLQAGQELHFYGKASGAIGNGQAVMFAGVEGDHLLMSLADATTINANPQYFIGVATQDFANNDFGYVTVLGKVRGLDTSARTQGAVLYYDSTSATDGLLTETVPTAPNAKIEVAAVVRVHATQGVLMVRPHIMPKISMLSDVHVSSIANNDLLTWATNRFENKSIATILGYTPANDASVVKLTGSQSIAGDKRFLDNAIFDFGIGLRTPAGLYQYFEALNGGGYRLGVVTAEHDFYFSTANNYSYTFPAASGTIALTSNLSAYLPLAGGTLTGALFGASASFSGFVGFGGNTSPLAAIDVTGAGRFSSSVTATNFILSGGTGSTGLYFGHTDRVVLANYGVGGIDFEVNGGAIVSTLFPSGNFGLGIALDAGYKLDVNGTARISGALSGTSATFSGALTTLGDIFITGASKAIVFNSAVSYATQIYESSGSLLFNTGSNTRLTLASTGAATFSSSVTATSTTATGGFMEIQGSANAIKTFYLNRYGVASGSQHRLRAASNYFEIASANSEAIVLTGGNVLINTTTDSGEKLYVNGSGRFVNQLRAYNLLSDNQIKGSNYVELSPDQGTYNAWNIRLGAQAADACYFLTAGGVNIMTTEGYNNPYTVKLYSNGVQTLQMTNGSLLINKTSLSASSVGVEFERNSTTRMTADGNTVLLLNRLTSDGTIVDFRRSTTQVGTISVTTSATSYNTSSDYRLKQDLKSFNGLEVVSKIKAYDYEWKADNTRSFGVLAHELAEVLPYAVNGIKDGETMQGVDYSKIVPVLIQSIKELKSKIETLENK